MNKLIKNIQISMLQLFSYSVGVTHDETVFNKIKMSSIIDPMQKGNICRYFYSYTNMNKFKSLHHAKEHP